MALWTAGIKTFISLYIPHVRGGHNGVTFYSHCGVKIKKKILGICSPIENLKSAL